MSVDGPRHRLPKSTPLVPGDPALKGAAAAKTEALIASRVAQFNSYSCSVASMATVVNAIRRLQAAGGAPSPLTQQQILERVDCRHWRERVSDAGFHGLHGMPLADFGEVAAACLAAFRVPVASWETVAVNNRIDGLARRRERLYRALCGLDASPRRFLIAHFTQGEYFGEWYGGHISPLGAFDRRMRRVLVLDVDPECPSPYWVAFERFFEGLVGRSKVIGSPGGGYVDIRLKGGADAG